MNDTPYGLRVMATDQPTNKSVGSCPKDTSTTELNKQVALHESIWIGGSPDWTALQIHLGKNRNSDVLGHSHRKCSLLQWLVKIFSEHTET